MGRRTLLTPARIEAIGLAIEDGDRPEVAGVSARSVRRWRAMGRSELEGLSAPALLELRLREAEQRAEARTQALSWEATAHLLDDLARDDVLADLD
jgi:hypothetical protein